MLKEIPETMCIKLVITHQMLVHLARHTQTMTSVTSCTASTLCYKM